MNHKALAAPEWLARSAVYQINPRTFSEAGTIKAVTDQIPFLSSLGFRILYLCPIYKEDDSPDQRYWSKRQLKSQTNNPKNQYRISNYYEVDVEFGTMEDLREFIRTAHNYGCRVLMDVVYLHVGPCADLIKDHPSYARRDENGQIICSEYGFPYLDFGNGELREYLWSNMQFYISELDADGFRCDVADKIPLDFWIEARKRVLQKKSDAVLINEGKKAESLCTAFDAIYGIAWHDALHEVLGGTAAPAALYDSWRSLNAPDSVLPEGGISLRDIDNHDTVTDWVPRVEVMIGHAGMEMVEVLNYIVDGIPMVYCGDEIGDTTTISMFSNRFYRGKYSATDRNAVMAEEYSKRRQAVIKLLNKLKQSSDVLRFGKTVWDVEALQKGVAFLKRIWKNSEMTLIANLTSETIEDFSITECVGETVLECGVTKSNVKIRLDPFAYSLISHAPEESADSSAFVQV